MCLDPGLLLFLLAMAGVVKWLSKPHDKPAKPAKTAEMDLRNLTADELYDAPLEALKAEEHRLMGIWLDAFTHHPKALARVYEVKAAISWIEVGGSRRPPSTKPTNKVAPLVRTSTAVVKYDSRRIKNGA